MLGKTDVQQSPEKTSPAMSLVNNRSFIYATLLATTISLLFTLAIIHFSPISEILISHTQYAPTKDFKELGEYEQVIIDRMIKEKSIITVDSLWSMQVSFYQTIVSLLIALNAAILVIAFVIIRSSSKAEVIKSSIEQFREFSRSGNFTKLVERKAKKEVTKINLTYGDMLDAIEELGTRANSTDDAIIVISNRLAELDNSEDDELKTEESVIR
ncbi:hypothetical protein [Pseudomonas sp. RA_15y_Pfl2_54]|uniref:hypothetical protein n=1 Tax=Pseudomonas sp. RA_15y_Pfl2_54 TaxID=3088704 RepID=UPI0030D89B0F